jgi:hypothetical protein
MLLCDTAEAQEPATSVPQTTTAAAPTYEFSFGYQFLSRGEVCGPPDVSGGQFVQVCAPDRRYPFGLASTCSATTAHSASSASSAGRAIRKATSTSASGMGPAACATRSAMRAA